MDRNAIIRLIRERTGCSLYDAVQDVDRAGRDFTTRDRFAACAVIGLSGDKFYATTENGADTLARSAYAIANAMMRQKGEM